MFNEYLCNMAKEKKGDYKEVKYSIGYFLFSKDKAKKQKTMKIPLLNFDTDLKKFPYYKKIMEKENINPEDFILRQIPFLINESVSRSSAVKIKNLKIKYEKDDIFKGKLKAVLSFSLPSGSYATILIKKMFAE